MNKEFFKNMKGQIIPSEGVEQKLRQKIEQTRRGKKKHSSIMYVMTTAACLVLALLVTQASLSWFQPGNQSKYNNTPLPGIVDRDKTTPDDKVIDNEPTPAPNNPAESEQPDGIGGQTPLLDIYEMRFTSFAYPFWKFAGGDDEFMEWANKKVEALKNEAAGDLTKNTDPTVLDLINDFNISKEAFINAANDTENGLEPYFTADEIEIIYSKDMESINKEFMNPAALLVNGKIYPMQWLMDKPYSDWIDAGIEPDAAEIKARELDALINGETLTEIKDKINGYREYYK